MLMKNLMWWNLAILTAQQSLQQPMKSLPFDITMQLCNTATSILLYTAHQKLMITITIKWLSNNHNKGRFTQYYLSWKPPYKKVHQS